MASNSTRTTMQSVIKKISISSIFKKRNQNTGSAKTNVPPFLKPDEFVKIIADNQPNRKSFMIHKEIAVLSPVFAAAFNGPFIEGQSQTYELEDASAETVRLLCGWLYTRKLDVDITKRWATTEEMTRDEWDIYDDKKLVLLALADVWILGDKLLLPGLQNCAVRLMMDLMPPKNMWQERVQYYTCYTGLSEYVDENTTEESALRRLWTHEIATFFEEESAENIRACKEETSPGMLWGALEFMGAAYRSGEPFDHRSAYGVMKALEFEVPENK